MATRETDRPLQRFIDERASGQLRYTITRDTTRRDPLKQLCNAYELRSLKVGRVHP